MLTPSRRRPAILVLFGTLAAGLMALESAQVLATPTDETEPRAGSLKKPGVVAKELDRLLNKAWKQAKIKPSRKTSDEEFLRRVSLDLTGSIPDEEETRSFLATTGPQKRAKKIEQLLASDGYARSFGLRWSYLLVGRQYLIRSQNVKRAAKAAKRMREMGMGMGENMEDLAEYGNVLTLTDWLEKSIKENRGWDQVTSDLVAANGRVDQNPAAHYMLRFRDGKAPEMTGNVMRVFQGLQIQCAQCHDDPYDRWKQKDFWKIAAFFSRTNARRTPPLPNARVRKNGMKVPGPFQVFDRPDGQIRIPAEPGEEGPLVLPEFVPTGRVISPARGVNRRAKLAELVTAKDNPYFARAMVNRMWSFLFGKGIVPVDDINQNAEDVPLPEVLQLLEDDFKQSDYDMRRLAQVIVSTRAYQLSSEGEGEEQVALFARAPLRALSAEQLFYSVLQATGVEDLRQGNRRQRGKLERMKFQMLRQFIQTFGDDEMEEVEDAGTVPEALMLLNGPLTNDAVRPRPGHPVYDRLFRMPSLDERMNTIYLRVLGRTPTRAEKKTLTKYLNTAEARQAKGMAQAYADVFWALLNSSEFNLNH